MTTDGDERREQVSRLRFLRHSENDALDFEPTQQQRDRFLASSKRVLEEIDRLLADSEALDPEKPQENYLGQGYMKLMDAELARLKLMQARFDAGELDQLDEQADKSVAQVAEFRARFQANAEGHGWSEQ